MRSKPTWVFRGFQGSNGCWEWWEQKSGPSYFRIFQATSPYIWVLNKTLFWKMLAEMMMILHFSLALIYLLPLSLRRAPLPSHPQRSSERKNGSQRLPFRLCQEQRDRDQALHSFKTGRTPVMLATDVAVSWRRGVINGIFLGGFSRPAAFSLRM